MGEAYGDCVVKAIDNPGGVPRAHIVHADPVVRITPQLLADLPKPPSEWPMTFDGKVLRIEGVNRTVVYRIREALEARPGAVGYWDYIGEWPD